MIRQVTMTRCGLAAVTLGALAVVAPVTATAIPIRAVDPSGTCFGLRVTINLNNPDHPDPNRPQGDVVLGTPENPLDSDDYDRIFTGGGDDVVCADGGNDVIVLGPGNDRVRGGPGDDILTGGPGDDVLLGGADRDMVDYWHANHAITIDLGIEYKPQSTGLGRDTVGAIESVYGSRFHPNTFLGTGGRDFLYGGEAADLIYGYGDRDLLDAGFLGEGDRVYGGAANDMLSGAGLLVGGKGNDFLEGYQGGDVLRGGPGNDGLYPEALSLSDPYTDDPYVPSQTFGGLGDDAINADWRDETLDGGPGRDLVSYGLASVKIDPAPPYEGVQVNLALTEPQDTGPTGVDLLLHFEGISGTVSDDVLTGGDGPDIIWAHYGNDTIDGGGGADQCIGSPIDDPFTDDTFTNCENVENPCSGPQCNPWNQWPLPTDRQLTSFKPRGVWAD